MGRDALRSFTYSLISDMHLDHPQPKTPYDKLEQNIIVAGDTMNGLGGLKFLNKLRNKGFTVYAVDGNHEHYCNVNQRRPLKETVDRFTKEFPCRIDIDETLTILLINGWYRVEDPWDWFNYMNDARCVVGMNAIEAMHTINLRAYEDYEFINDAINGEPNRRFIVVTHTAPCLDTLDPRFEGKPSNAYYWNPKMREIIDAFSSQILVWNHGHTHASQDKEVNGVRVVCNPRGYPRENPDWFPLSISVEY